MPAKAERLSVLEAQQAQPGFWADPDAARASVQEIKTLKNWLTPYDNLDNRLRGSLEMAELLEAEPDQVLEGELAREADELDTAAESFELQAMLQGPEDARDALRAPEVAHEAGAEFGEHRRDADDVEHGEVDGEDGGARDEAGDAPLG